MAFPQISPDNATETPRGTVTSNSTSWTLTYPSNLVSGDLILALVASDGTNSYTFPAGFVNASLTGGGSACELASAKKLSDGTESGNFTLTLANSEQGAWRCFRITGWEGTLGTTFFNASDAGAVVRAGTGATDQNPNPPSLNPLNWDVEDTLWFAVCAVDTSRTISVWPLADRNTSDVSGGAGGATLGICTTTSAVASLDPGTFTISNSDDWAAATIAVRPAAAVAAADLYDLRPRFVPILAQ